MGRNPPTARPALYVNPRPVLTRQDAGRNQAVPTWIEQLDNQDAPTASRRKVVITATGTDEGLGRRIHTGREVFRRGCAEGRVRTARARPSKWGTKWVGYTMPAARRALVTWAVWLHPTGPWAGLDAWLLGR